jgi:hypothetical protein
MNKVEKYLKQKEYIIIDYENTAIDFMTCYYNLKITLVDIKKPYKIIIEINDKIETEEELIAKLDEILK